MSLLLSRTSNSSDLRERNFYHEFLNPYAGIGKGEAIDRIDSSYRFLSFCTEPNKTEWWIKDQGYRLPNMWDSYANRHRGACIVLDEDKFREANPGLDCVEIKYLNEEDLHKICSLEDKIRTKPLCYSQENEVRYLTRKGVEKCTIAGCISKVIIGVDMSERYINSLISLIKYKRIMPQLFIQPIVDEDGRILVFDNGCLLWEKMRKAGLNFEGEDK